MKILIGILFGLFSWSQQLAAQVAEPESMVLAGSVDYQSQIGRVIGMLFIILVLIFAAVWLMKKIGVTGTATKGPLSIKACLPLSNKEKLYVIQVGDEQILIGLSANGISPLKTLKKPIEDNNTLDIPMSAFSKKLQKMMKTDEIAEPKKTIKETEPV